MLEYQEIQFFSYIGENDVKAKPDAKEKTHLDEKPVVHIKSKMVRTTTINNVIRDVFLWCHIAIKTLFFLLLN